MWYNTMVSDHKILVLEILIIMHQQDGNKFKQNDKWYICQCMFYHKIYNHGNDID